MQVPKEELHTPAHTQTDKIKMLYCIDNHNDVSIIIKFFVWKPMKNFVKDQQM